MQIFLLLLPQFTNKTRNYRSVANKTDTVIKFNFLPPLAPNIQMLQIETTNNINKKLNGTTAYWQATELCECMINSET